jgi:tetratricopeptide (TPR) repeat protein
VIPQLHGSSGRFRHWMDADRVWLLIHTGDTLGAARLAPQAIENAARAGWPDKALLARWAWGYALRENGQLEEADRVLNARADSPHGPVGGEFPRPGLPHASVKLALGNAEQALSIVDAALKRASVIRIQMDPFIADHHRIRGQTLLKLGRAGEAREALRIADEYWRGYFAESPWAAEAQYWHGQALIATGDTARGRQWVQEMRPRLAKSPMPSHRALAASTEVPR